MSSSTLASRLRKTSTIKNTNTLSKSSVFNDVTITVTPVPILNVALSGSVDGGLPSGVTVLAGPSRHFKCLGPDVFICVYSETEIPELSEYLV